MSDRKFRIPAEWEPQEAVYLAVPPGNEIDPQHFHEGTRSVADVQIEMIRALKDVVSVRVIAPDQDAIDDYGAKLKLAGLDPACVEFVTAKYGDIWVRDTGPIWREYEDGEIALTWMGFNNWGYQPYIEGDWAKSDVPNMLPAQIGQHVGKAVHRTTLVGEGGDKSFNGKDAMICCKAVETDRNPQLSVPEIERRLREAFGVERIIWVQEGLFDDSQTFRVRVEYGYATLPGGIFTPLCTGGHIDEYCRFVGENRVLLAEVHPSVVKAGMTEVTAMTQFRMEGNLALLNKQVDAQGKALEILRMPLPPEMIYTIDDRDPCYSIINQLRGVSFQGPIRIILAGSYCNYLVSNGVVCFPQYYREGMDEIVKEIDADALAVIKQAFPDHRIAQINPMPVNAGGGGMHCISNHQPRGGGHTS